MIQKISPALYFVFTPLETKGRQQKNLMSLTGFTFIELLLVVALIGILVGLSIPQLRNTFDKFELENFVKNIYYLSLYLEASAVSQRKIYCLNIELEEARFRATYKGEGEFKSLTGRFSKAYKIPARIMVFTEKGNIYFYPDGSIDEAEIEFENIDKYRISLIFQGASGGIKIQ